MLLNEYQITNNVYEKVFNKKLSHTYTKRNKNNLFHTFLMLYYGKQHNYADEMDIKIKIIEYFKKNSSILKNNKLKISEIEDNLVYSKNINHKSLFAISLYHNTNIIYVYNKTYYRFFSHIDPEKISMIEENDCTINYKNELSMYEYNNISETHLLIENIDKPIRSVSFYKVGVIIHMCNKLGINLFDENGKKRNKNILYNYIKKLIKQ